MSERTAESPPVDPMAQSLAATEALVVPGNKLRMLSQISNQLAIKGSTTSRAIEAAVDHLAVSIGDACMVAMIDSTGVLLYAAGYRHRNPTRQPFLVELFHSGTGKVGVGAVGRVAATGRPESITQLPNERTSEVLSPMMKAYLHKFGIAAMLAAPILVDSIIVGSLVLVRDRPGQAYSEAEGHVVDDMAKLLGHDIARWQLQTELEASEIRLGTMFDEAAIGMGFADLDGRLFRVNPLFASIAGRSQAELVGFPFIKLTHPQDRHLDKHVVADLTIGGVEEAIFEERYLRPDNSVVWVRVRVSLRAEDGIRTGLSAQIEDITQAKNDDSAPAQAERRYRLLASNTADVVVRITKAGAIEWISPSVRAMLGWDPIRLLGRPVDELIHPDDFDLQPSYLPALGRSQRAGGQIRVKRFNGEYLWVSAISQLVVNDATEPIGTVVSWHNAEVAVNAREELEESEDRFREMAKNASDIVWRADQLGVVEWISPAVVDVLGWTVDELVGTRMQEIVHPDQQSVIGEKFTETDIQDGSARSARVQMRSAAGEFIWMDMTLQAQRDDGGSVNGSVGGLRNVNDEENAREALTQSERQLRLAIDGSPQGMAVIRLDFRFLEVSDVLCQILGRTEEWLLAHSLTDVIHPDDVESDLLDRDAWLAGTSERNIREIRVITASGKPTWVLHAATLLRDDANMPLFYVSHMSEITKARQQLTELTFQAKNDSLTGLGNRQMLIDHLERITQGAPGQPMINALLYCDLDSFKAVNDTLGHAGGDEVLVKIAHRIAAEVRHGDLVTRIGGDEFVIVLANIDDQVLALAIADKLRRIVSRPFEVAGSTVTIGMSIGMCMVSAGDDERYVLHEADAALYQAKRLGKNKVVSFESLHR